MRQLAEARAAEPWLWEGSSSVQQQALRDFDKAMTAFFDPRNPAGKPSYRSRRGTQGFVIRDVKARRLNRNHAEVFVPKCGYVRFRLSRDLPADPGMARVTCDRSGCWHVAFPGPQPAIGRQPAGAAAGVDRGVRTALVTSGGQHYRVPRISDRRAARYLALQRRMSRQQKGSRKREKTRRAMAAITVKVTDRRKDWAEKISTRLVRDHDLIVFEKLRTKDMVRKPKPKPDPDQPGAFLPNRRRQKAGLNRGTLASCWGLLAATRSAWITSGRSRHTWTGRSARRVVPQDGRALPAVVSAVAQQQLRAGTALPDSLRRMRSIPLLVWRCRRSRRLTRPPATLSPCSPTASG